MIGAPEKIRYAKVFRDAERELSDQRDDSLTPEMRSDDGGAADGAPRVRFKGIVEAGPQAAAALAFEADAETPRERRWNAMSRQVWQASRLTALFVFFSVIVGMPLGNYFAHLQLNGSAAGWNPLAAFAFDTLLLAVVIPVLVLLAGYLLSKGLTMVSAAESIAAAAQQMTTPDVTAARNADSVGEVVRGHVTALNEGLDGALGRLANVEAMIRDHVAAIELAGDAIEHKATGAVERVADERARLMDLTESLNAHADSFAAAIAERAKVSIEALNEADTVSTRAEQDFDDRLSRLEEAAARALASFESLRDALRDTDETMRASAQSIDEAAQDTMSATDRAKAAADAAAESAARNAANVSASASRAAAEAKKAADDAIEAATREAERMAQAAIDAAVEETAKVRDAAAHAIDDVAGASKEALSAARKEADRATQAAAEVAEAARLSSEASKSAADQVAAASAEARQTSEEAIKYADDAASHIDQRNKALAEARRALEKENARLETLIEEQRNRADRLANAIASQTERLTKLAEAQLSEQEAAARLAESQAMRAREAARLEEERARQNEERRQAAAAAAAAENAAKAEADAKQKAREEAEAAQKAAAREEEALIARRRPSPTRPSETAAPKKSNGAARLEELARDIAERRPRRPDAPPTATAREDSDKKRKADLSWREILDAADDAAPLDLGQAARRTDSREEDPADNAIRIIAGLQQFTYELETRLYGDPPPALQERYDRGDRNVFANRLLRLNEADVKRRIRSESARDRKFESGVHEFLQSFEKLLEDATTSETADEELEEYLSSPLGRVYLLIGATVGYFA